MPSFREHFGSYLKVEELIGKTVRVIVEKVALEPVKQESGAVEQKLVVRFVGKEKGLVLNKTNGDSLFSITGTDNYDQWAGAMIVLYVDPNVMMGAKKVGGIRIKAAQLAFTGNAPAPALPPPPPPPPAYVELPNRPQPAVFTEPGEDITADDIPF